MSNPIMFSGLSSGIDWQTMIDQLMAVERRPIQLIQQRQNTLKLQNQAWMDINNRLTNLQNNLSTLKQTATFLGRKTSVSDDKVVTASAAADAFPGTYRVTVHQLATASSRESDGSIGRPLDTDVSLNKAGFAGTITSGTITINGKQYTIAADEDSLDDLAARLSDDGIQLTYDAQTDTLTLATDDPSETLTLGSAADTSNFLKQTRLASELTAGASSVLVQGLGTVQTNVKLADARFQTALTSDSGSFTINNVTIEWDANVDTLQTLINRINRSDAGVTARYDSYSDTILLESKETGSQDIVLGNDTGGMLAALRLSTSTLHKGQNAVITVKELNGGQPITSTSNEVKLAGGLTLNLLEADPDKEITVTVTSDIDKAMSAIKSFVEQYNSVQAFIQEKLDVGDPLNRNSGGVLAGNPSLMRIQNSLRQLVSRNFAGLDGAYKALHEIGITTSTDRSARLEIDEAKLREALELHPADVQALFFGETNIAHTVYGTTVTASSEADGYPISAIIDGITTSSGQGWRAESLPSTVTLNFGQFRHVEKVVIYTRDSGTYQATELSFTIHGFPSLGQQIELAQAKGNASGIVTSYVPSTRTDRLEITIDGHNDDSAYPQIIEIEVYENTGLAAELDRLINGYIRGKDSVITTQRDGLQTTIDDLNKQVERLERRIEMQRQTMIRQFVALETALAQMQSQGAWLSSQIAGLQANWLRE